MINLLSHALRAEKKTVGIVKMDTVVSLPP